jgi:hypothetical protein
MHAVPSIHRQRVLQRAVKRADESRAAQNESSLPEGLTLHSLRRTYASILFAIGRTALEVMALSSELLPLANEHLPGDQVVVIELDELFPLGLDGLRRPCMTLRRAADQRPTTEPLPLAALARLLRASAGIRAGSDGSRVDGATTASIPRLVASMPLRST